MASGGKLLLIPASIKATDITRVLREGYDVGLLNTGFQTLIDELALDVLIVDTHPGLNEETLVSLTLSDVLLLVLCKNLLCPLAVWGLGSALGVEQLWLATAVLMAAMPAGINAFIFASQYDVRQDTVAKTIVVSTLSSTLVASMLLAWFMA